jgi:hypothetical protein
MNRLAIISLLILTSCANENVGVQRQGLITPEQVIARCDHACSLPVDRCTNFNQESCVEQCLNVNESLDAYTRQDIEYFEDCIQCHIRQVCENKFAPDCFPDCLLHIVSPHSGCPYDDPNAGI